jgi:hypothetical protein
MLTKIFAAAAIAIALLTVIAAYSQRSALVLREESQEQYWPRRGTSLSGSYGSGGNWQPLPNRSTYGGFRGGGPSAGK